MPDTSDPRETNIPPEIVESVAINNVKTLGESVASITAGSLADHHAHRGRVNTLAEGLMANAAGFAQSVTAQAVKAVSESDLGEQLAQLNASLASGQVSTKTAQTTPPQTGTGGSGP